MTALPAKGDLDGTTGGHNQGMFKTAIGNMRDYLAGLFGTGGTPATALDAIKLLDPSFILNFGISFSVGSNALTATVADSKGSALSSTNPGFAMMRHATLSNGTMNLRTATANFSTVISSGSTAGHQSAIEGYLHWYLIDNAGTLELAWSSKDYGESGIVTTTAEGGAGAADSATVMYSTTGRTNVPFRKLATTKDTQTTAGNWTAIPSTVQPGRFGVDAKLDVEGQSATGGASVTSKDLGTISSGTVTPDPSARALQHYSNNGAHTLAPHTKQGVTIVDITNTASAGAVTTSGFTLVTGDSFTTTNGDKFRCTITIGNVGSQLNVEAFQ
jgi:hypothetical protein